jgi:hypothetical protein
MNTATLDVMFICPSRRVAVKSEGHPRTTYRDFQDWQDREGNDQRVNCPACGATHLLVPEDFFLEAAAR